MTESKRLTVGDIRRAIDGMDDDASLCLHIHYTMEADELAYVTLNDVRQSHGLLCIEVVVDELDPYDDDDDDEEDDQP